MTLQHEATRNSASTSRTNTVLMRGRILQPNKACTVCINVLVPYDDRTKTLKHAQLLSLQANRRATDSQRNSSEHLQDKRMMLWSRSLPAAAETPETFQASDTRMKFINQETGQEDTE